MNSASNECDRISGAPLRPYRPSAVPQPCEAETAAPNEPSFQEIPVDHPTDLTPRRLPTVKALRSGTSADAPRASAAPQERFLEATATRNDAEVGSRQSAPMPPASKSDGCDSPSLLNSEIRPRWKTRQLITMRRNAYRPVVASTCPEQQPAIAGLPRVSDLHERGPKIDVAERSIALTWWFGFPMAAGVAFVLFGFTFATVENGLANYALAELAARLENPKADRQRLADDLAAWYDSPFSRFDGRRDYLVARALAALEQPRTHNAFAAERSENANAIYHNVVRAVQRAPANPWLRLTRAQLGERFGWDEEERSANWAAVDGLSNAEPGCLLSRGHRLLNGGKIDEAIAMFRRYLEVCPEQAASILMTLAGARVPTVHQLAVLPDEPIALGSAVGSLKEQGAPEWKTIADRMLSLPRRSDRRQSAEELAAEGIVALAMSQASRAAELLDQATRKRPDRLDWKQMLAVALYESKEYSRAAAILDSIVRADPGGELAADARLLRERITLVIGAAGIGQAN